LTLKYYKINNKSNLYYSKNIYLYHIKKNNLKYFLKKLDKVITI